MSTNKDITLYLDNRNPPPVVNVSQGDTDWLYRFTVMYNNAVYSPSVTYVILTGHKPDGHVFAYRGAKSGNLYTVTPANANGNLVQMTAVAGDVPCELRLISGGRSVGTANFILRVEPGPEGVVTVASASALPAYTTILQELGVLIGKVETLPDDVPGWIGDWLEEHISGGQGVAVDNTLSIQGAAADAKETGDRLRALEGATIETDDTLTVAGAAADAKAVGDVLGVGSFTLGTPEDWRRQSIVSGQRADSTKVIAMAGFLPRSVTHVTCAEGYASLIYRYTAAGEYVGFWKDNDFATSGSGTFRQEFDIPQDSYRYVLTMKKTDGSDITTAAAVNITSDADGESADGLIQRVEALEEALDDYDSGLADRVDAIEEELGLEEVADVSGWADLVPESWTIGAIIDGNGAYSTSSSGAPYSATANGYFSIRPSGTLRRTGPATDMNGVTITTWIHEYNGTTWLRRNYMTNEVFTVGDDCTQFRVCFARAISSRVAMTQADVDAYFGVQEESSGTVVRYEFQRISALESRVAALKRAEYEARVQRRMKLLTDIEWTALAPAPRFLVQGSTWTKTQWPAGTKITGIPYAAQLRYEQWAGRNITFETFLSAAANPNSVIYDFTRQQDSTLYHPGCWYSIVCSKAALFGIGVDANYASGYLANDPHISKVANAGAYTAEDIQVGDIIEKLGEHTAIVTDKIYSSFGRLVQIEVSEAVTPSCRRIRWNLEGNVRNFWDHWSDYYLLRYDNIKNVPDVDPESLIPYISETLGLNFGNKANYMTEDTAKVTILNPVGNSLIVTRDGTVVETIDVSGMGIGEEITITSSTPGFYSINFDGGEVKDAVEFLRDDSTCSYSGGVLTFSSTNGKLVRVAFAASGSRSHVGTDTVPTDEDREAGQITVTKPSSAAFIHAFFETQYGVLCREIAC